MILAAALPAKVVTPRENRNLRLNGFVESISWRHYLSSARPLTDLFPCQRQVHKATFNYAWIAAITPHDFYGGT